MDKQKYSSVYDSYARLGDSQKCINPYFVGLSLEGWIQNKTEPNITVSLQKLRCSPVDVILSKLAINLDVPALDKYYDPILTSLW